MFDILKVFGKQQSSKDVAKERLRFVLIQDRGTKLDSEIMEMLKNDIIGVINKYLEVDETALEIELTNDCSQNEEENSISQAIIANIPIKRVKK